MKIANETKIGALTVIAVTFFMLGFNFLKGKSLFKTGNFIYAKYSDIKKIGPSDPVYINGFKIGSVYETEAQHDDLTNITVSIKLDAPYSIPDNSVAAIESSPLGGADVDIALGNSTVYLKPGDTIKSSNAPGLLGTLSNKIGPVADQLKATLSTLDTVLKNVNTVLDPTTKGNLQSVVGSLSTAAANMVASTASLQKLLNTENGTLAKSLDNVNSFTKNLADNNDKITHVLSNIDSTTTHLSKADIDGVVNTFKVSAGKLNSLLEQANSTNGSVGALLNSKELYNNINNSVRSLNILMDDLRVHPKRYVNISVFGKKEKGNYLISPLNDSTKAVVPNKTPSAP